MKKIIYSCAAFVLFSLPPLQVSHAANEIEPNGDLSSAMPIYAGQALKGDVAPEGEFDVYKFTPAKTGKASVLYHRPPHGYVYNIAKIRVLDNTGAEITNKLVYAPDEYTDVDFDVTAGRGYYIEISGCPSSSCDVMGGKIYEVMVFNYPGPLFESEPNSTLAQAGPVAANSLIYANHSSFTDDDFFKIYLPGAGDFFVQLSRETDEYQYILADVAILNASGKVLNADKVYAPNGTSRLVLGVKAPQTIFVRVRSCNSGGRCEIHYNDDYQLLTSFDATAKLSIVDVSVAEGNAGTKVATFTVKLSQPTTSAVKYNIATSNGSALAGQDYEANNLTGQTIPIGQISKTFSVTIKGDITKESDETFFANVTNVIGATVVRGKAKGTIRNDD